MYQQVEARGDAMYLILKWRQILLLFHLTDNWPSKPRFKVNILLNSAGAIEALKG